MNRKQFFAGLALALFVAVVIVSTIALFNALAKPVDSVCLTNNCVR